MEEITSKTHAIRSLWFEFFSAYPTEFERRQQVDGQLADFYSEKAQVAVFVDAGKLGKADGKSKVRKLYFTSNQIENERSLVCAIIDCHVKNELLPGMKAR